MYLTTVKAIFNQPTINIMVNGGKAKFFFSFIQEVDNDTCPVKSIHVILEALAREIGKERDMEQETVQNSILWEDYEELCSPSVGPELWPSCVGKNKSLFHILIGVVASCS